MKPECVKVKAIDEFRRPKTKQEVRAFLGLVGYIGSLYEVSLKHR